MVIPRELACLVTNPELRFGVRRHLYGTRFNLGPVSVIVWYRRG